MIELSDSSWDTMLVHIADRADLHGRPKDAFYLRYKEENLQRFDESQNIQTVVDSLDEWDTDFQNFTRNMTKVFKTLSLHTPLNFRATSDKHQRLYDALSDFHAQECLNKRNSYEDCEASLGNILPFIDMKDLVKAFRKALEASSSQTASFCFPFLSDKKAVLQQLVMCRLIASLPFQSPPMIKEVRVPIHWGEQDSSDLLTEIAQSLKFSPNCMIDELADQALTKPTILIFQDAQHFGDNITNLLNKFWFPIVEKVAAQEISKFNKKAILFLNYKQEMRGIDYYIDFQQPNTPDCLPSLRPLTTKDVSDWVEDKPNAYKLRCQIIEKYPNCKGKQIKEWEDSKDTSQLSDDIFEAFQIILDVFSEDQKLSEMREYFRFNGALVA